MLFKSIPRGQVPLDGYAGVTWSLPAKGAPGSWMPDVSPLVPFKSGYHLHGPRDLMDFHLIGVRVWLAEARGASLDRGPGRHFSVHESARLLRELDWSFEARLRVALATAREALACIDHVEAHLPLALAEVEGLAAPTPEALREIDARVLQPNRPRGLSHWEEEIEDDPEGRLLRRAAFDRHMTVSWALGASPPSTLMHALGAVGGGAPAARLKSAHEARVWGALFRGEVSPGLGGS